MNSATDGVINSTKISCIDSDPNSKVSGINRARLTPRCQDTNNSEKIGTLLCEQLSQTSKRPGAFAPGPSIISKDFSLEGDTYLCTPNAWLVDHRSEVVEIDT